MHFSKLIVAGLLATAIGAPAANAADPTPKPAATAMAKPAATKAKAVATHKAKTAKMVKPPPVKAMMMPGPVNNNSDPPS